MKKTTIKKEQKDFFHITNIIGDVAIIRSSISGKSGLLNIETNALIGSLDYYSTKIYSTKIDASQVKIIQTKNNPTSINYYDTEKHEYIVYDFELVKTLDKENIYLLKSKVNNKTYLLDENTYTDSTSIFDIEADEADYLSLTGNYHFDHNYLVLTLNGKKAIYKVGNGLVTEFEFDEINPNYGMNEYGITYGIQILKKGDKYCFSYHDDFSSISEEFDRIEVDKNYKYILYCYSDKDTYVYDLYNKLLVLKITKKVEHVDKFRYNGNYNEYLFIAREDDKQEILGSVVNNDSKEINVKTLISGCDKINYNLKGSTYNKGSFYLETNKRKGIFLGNSSKNIIIEPNYTDVEYLGKDFYILTSNDVSDIVRFDYNLIMETIIKSCSIVDKTNYAVIYSKKDSSEAEKFGLFFPNNGNVIPATSASIKVLSQCFYEALENGKKGVFYLGNLIIPKEYENIQISFSPKHKELDDANRVYFSLEKEKSCLLARRWCFPSSEIKEGIKTKLETLGEYNDISFLKDIIVCRTLDSTYIYDYDYILLCKVSSNAVIAPVELKTDYSTSLYNIDGIYYYYRDNKLIKLYQNVINSYITTYETDTDVFEVSTFDKKTLEDFSNYIDSMEDNLGEETLMNYSSDNRSLKEKYPSLVLKKTKRNN